LFAEAYDLYELMCRPTNDGGAQQDSKRKDCTCAKDQKIGASLPRCDVALSTAVLNSARFPVVSPPGNIPSESGKIAQRIVDGGYFENFGAVTAIDIADAIKQIDKSLEPFILLITNDPESFPQDCGVNEVPPAAQPDRLLGILNDPIEAVLNARTAHGYRAVENVRAWMKSNSKQRHPAKIIVCPKKADTPKEIDRPLQRGMNQVNSPTERQGYKDLSMSWWLSMPVQKYLHDQVHHVTESAHNRIAFECLRAILARRTDDHSIESACSPSSESKPGPQGFRQE